ncbi:UDP-2,4-diacetamido-2,4,6-trideoxy-beta-L-altropyranose hydrolase [Thalassolituus maritimus]|uniref:UDP-2,4-diacetamido-2,4,6-trideoxy-beta-L-altropyranose hydrolase n=2 Tax=Thalassolituus maritimus TaxID=484498 RepID=A0A1N7LM76_9GAMM|nr:UDP-2,4-diacetamido-2,4,6-trideoxy-beta-L-altropyranose hydrolase [Thalassolituus maritimus]
MRCLTLARAAMTQGHEICFFVSDIDAALEKRINATGIRIIRLPSLEYGCQQSSVAIEAEYETSQQETEAQCFLRTVAGYQLDWIVVDHYGYGEPWISAIKRAGYCLLLIEDWPHRKVSADLLLDPRPGSIAGDYRDYIKPENVLSGSDFNLIREEFFHEPCQPAGNVQRVLLNLGGYDYRGLSADILDALANEDFAGKLSFTVLLSQSSPAFSRIQSHMQSAQYPFSVNLIEHCDDMAGLYRTHHVCIGASGGSLWERIAMRLPTALVIVADNQKPQASYAEDNGLVKVVADYSGTAGSFDVSAFRSLVESDEVRQSMQDHSSDLLRSDGSKHVIKAVENTKPEGLTLRSAIMSDIRDFYRWQKQPGARRFFRTPQLPRWSQHRRWYQGVMSDPSVSLYIVLFKGEKAGYVRVDGAVTSSKSSSVGSSLGSSLGSSEVSILISRNFRGRKLAVNALKALVSRYPETRFCADVAPGNFASRKVFKRAGFQKTGGRRYEY